ncbi:MAG: hypothetical protein KKF78_03455 [Candidatus Omnitrophica bacterium]|nr:hypothetical protein [Candidatus Omnitrophota bacterium]MBU1996195.1 hypothetical protein [Candidatus Omnitrophota bacterium]
MSLKDIRSVKALQKDIFKSMQHLSKIQISLCNSGKLIAFKKNYPSKVMEVDQNLRKAHDFLLEAAKGLEEYTGDGPVFFDQRDKG